MEKSRRVTGTVVLSLAMACGPISALAQEGRQRGDRQERRSERRSEPRREGQRAPENRSRPVEQTRPSGNFGPGRNQPPAGPARPQVRPGPPASQPYATRSGDVIRRDSQGQIRQMRLSNGTRIFHPPNAPRRVEVVRPGGRIVVAGAPGHGYIQRPVTIHNTTLVKRTYVYGGTPQVRFFRPRVYHGVTLNVYTPVRYYRPAFYSWFYNPWARPVVYSFGWAGQPWYGYYGGYFTPYPAYASPALWLTDYVIASTLQSAYDERMAAASAASAYPAYGQAQPMSPEVKQAIADEVRRQLEREQAEEQSAGAAQDAALFGGGGPHVFVVNAALPVNSNAGECSVSEGAVLQMNGPPPANATYAPVTVLSSRPGDCPRGTTVSVWLQDLQEMQNQMRASMDRGLSQMQSQQGQGGLPNLPPNYLGTIDSPYAQEAQPDPNAAAELTSATQEADRNEQQLASAPPTLSLGQTIDEVTAMEGQPRKIVDLGSRKIYVYKDLKITFTGGKVTDIQ